jgi:hypothetical protein
LQRRLGNLFGRLVQPGVDDFKTMVAKGARDGLGTAVVTIEARLRNDHSIGALHE